MLNLLKVHNKLKQSYNQYTFHHNLTISNGIWPKHFFYDKNVKDQLSTYKNQREYHLNRLVLKIGPNFQNRPYLKLND